MVKKLAILVLSLALTIVSLANAELKDDITKLVGDNATNYIHPLTNSLGIGMNSGWYNSSKSYSLFKVPVGLQVYFGEPMSVVNDNLRTYTFKGDIGIDNMITDPIMASALKTATGKNILHIEKPGASTFVGPAVKTGITFKELLLSNGITAADTSSGIIGAGWSALPNDTVLNLPPGQNLDMVPSVPAVGFNLGLPYKVQIGVRFLPPLKVPNIGKISQLGIKAQYEFTQWVPVVSTLPLLHTSALFAFNNANFFDMLKLNNWTAMVNVSADFKFLLGMGLYGGLGIENSTMNLDYTVPITTPGLGGTKVSMKDDGDNLFKAMIGVRISLLIFDIMADATFAKTTSYYIGAALGFNGL